MKKIAVLLTALLFAVSLGVFVGCDNGSEIGLVKGKFDKEATAEELSSAVEKISEQKVFGDMTKENWEYGLKAKANFEVNKDVHGSYLNATGGINIDNALHHINYALNFSKDGVIGSGDMDSSVEGYAWKDEKMYNDSQYFYTDTNSYTGANNSVIVYKNKYSWENLFGHFLNTFGLSYPTAENMSFHESISYGLEQVSKLGGKVYLDESSGLKVKISLGEDMLKNIRIDTGLGISLCNFTFLSDVFDIYLVINKAGEFSKLVVDVDVHELDENESSFKGSYVSVKGRVLVQPYKGKVTLPEGLAEDKSFHE